MPANTTVAGNRILLTMLCYHYNLTGRLHVDYNSVIKATLDAVLLYNDAKRYSIGAGIAKE